MPLPVNVNTITVEGTYMDMSGEPLTGTVTFVASVSRLRDPDGDVIITDFPFEVTLDVVGSFSVELPATDDPDLIPSPWSYRVTEDLNDHRETFYIEVPLSTPGGVLRMDDVDRAVKVPTVITYAGRTEFLAHVDDATSVHGIANTGDLETKSGAQSKATTARLSAISSAQIYADDTFVPFATEMVHAARYGVVGDGVTDDTTALQAAVAAALVGNKGLYVPPAMSVKVSGQINMKLLRTVRFEGSLTSSYTAGPAVISGGSSSSRLVCNLLFNYVTYADAGTQTNVLIRLVGLKNGHVTVGRSEYVQLYADVADSSISSIAYSEFRMGYVKKLELYGEPGASWINENNFYGGAHEHIIINSGGYAHNANRWHGCSVEGAASTIEMLVGSGNEINARSEGGCQVTFGTGNGNVVIDHYVSGVSSLELPGFILAADGGLDNRIIGILQRYARSVEVYKVDKDSLIFDLSSEFNVGTTVPIPGLDLIQLRTSFAQHLDTGIFPVEAGVGSEQYTRIMRWWFESDQAYWRPIIYGYDANMAPVDPTATAWMSTSGGWVANAAGYYSWNTSVRAARMVLIHSSVKHIRIVVAAYATLLQSFKYFRIVASIPAGMADTPIQQARRTIARPLYQTSAPTQGAARPGQIVGQAGTGTRRCIFRLDTTLNGAVAAAATSVTLTSATGVAAGDLIGILQNDGTTHWTTVVSVAGTPTLTITAGMTSAAASGKAVVLNRWYLG